MDMYDWKKVILKCEDTMNTAIDVLNDEALGIVMVADDDGRLLGTITDGDIRRALIKHYRMESNLAEIMSETPTVASLGDDRKALLMMMKSKEILHMPILDPEKKIVGLETLHHILEDKKYDNPVVLMAGGFGSRLYPLTKDIPKPMLNVGVKPILETIFEQFIESGFYNFFVSIHYKAEIVRDYFGNGSQWGINIEYIYEDVPLGTAGALGLLPKDMSELPILMMNGDLLTRVSFDHLLKYHIEHGGAATICTREYDFQVPYGVIETDGYSVTNIIEKPVHNFFVNAGIYVLNPNLIHMIDGDSYLDMPNFLEKQIENNEQVNTFPIHEYWLDIGRVDEFERANQEIFTSFKTNAKNE